MKFRLLLKRWSVPTWDILSPFSIICHIRQVIWRAEYRHGEIINSSLLLKPQLSCGFKMGLALPVNRKLNFAAVWFITEASDTCLSNRAKSVCACAPFISVYVSLLAHSTRWGRVTVCISGFFWAYGCWCAFLPRHCLDCQSQLSNTSPYERQAEFTHSQSTPRCVRMCWRVLACLRVSVWRRVVDSLFIATAIPLCHQYLICHATCQRTVRETALLPHHAPSRG